MNKVVLLFCLIFLFPPAHAQSSNKWNQYYSLVNKDISNIRSLKVKDLNLNIRLFELYGEKYALLSQKENEYKLSYLDEKVSLGQIKKLNTLQSKTLKSMDRLARMIKKQTRDPLVLAKIYYYRALSYHLTKNYKVFYKTLKEAERLNRDQKLGRLINTKLADYHYNRKEYAQAKKYYQTLLNDKSDKWQTKHHFNLGWSLFKLGDSKRAINVLHKASLYDEQGGYYKLGDQLNDSLILFYANSQRINDGLAFLKKRNLDDFKTLIKFLHYAFEYSSAKGSFAIIKYIKSKELTAENKYELLTKEILVYRTFKLKKHLQNSIIKFNKSMKASDKVSEIKKNELINSLLSYTGYLQEIIKSNTLVSSKDRSVYSQFILFNFGVLRKIDPVNSVKYRFYQGETCFNLRNYKLATNYYIAALKEQHKNGTKKSDSLMKIFDSLFKTFEKSNTTSGKKLIFTYRSYLKFFPNSKLAPQIHERMVAYYYKTSQPNRMLAALLVYNKAFPARRNFQLKSYRELLDALFRLSNFKGVEVLRSKVEKGFLGLGKKELSVIDKNVAKLSFSKFEQLASKGEYKAALEGFHQLAIDKNRSYLIRMNAYRKKIFYQDKLFQSSDLADDLVILVGMMNNSDLKNYSEEIEFYLQNICYRFYIKECVESFDKIVKRRILNMSEGLKETVFKNRILLGESIAKLLPKADTENKRMFLFQQLIAQNTNYSSADYQYFYKLPQFKNLLENSIELDFWSLYFRTLNLGDAEKFARKIALPSLQNKYLSRLSNMKESLNAIQFKMPVSPQWKGITFEKFSQYNEVLVGSLFEKIKLIDSQVASVETNFISTYLSVAIYELKRVNNLIKGFQPSSTDQELVKAIQNELNNIASTLSQKTSELIRLYDQSFDATLDSTGANRYKNSTMLHPKGQFIKGDILWLD